MKNPFSLSNYLAKLFVRLLIVLTKYDTVVLYDSLDGTAHTISSIEYVKEL